MQENNEQQGSGESYTNKYKKHIACIYGYKLVRVKFKFELLFEVKFSKSSKSYIGEDVVYNFINNIIGESKYCTDIKQKKSFYKELVITKTDNKDFKNSNNNKCWICDDECVEGNVKVRVHCHITGKHRGSAYRDCNINVKLNHKIPTIFHNLKNYDSHLIMQELGKFILK